VTQSGNFDPNLLFWHTGGDKLVYTVDTVVDVVRDRLDGLADVVSLGSDIDFHRLLDDLGERGIGRLMVEGGGHIHTALLSAGLADEIHMAIAPLVVGQSDAPRFLHPAAYPGGPTHRMRLADARTIGDIVLIRYLPKA
jgi:5-amino-6-(5-phosphoribosylamino)uracil reductase